MRAIGWWGLVGLGLVVAAGAWIAIVRTGDGGPPQEALDQPRPAGAIPLAVMGDSDSHSYHDRLAFGPGSDGRGGSLRENTFNWVEILARLRPGEVDPGPWLTWGSHGRMSSVRRALGLPVGRIPMKEDYLYNFAASGAICDDLTSGPFRQAPWLAELMDKEPGRWTHGVVVVRIGINDWQNMLGLQARNPNAPEVDQAIARCTSRISEAMALLRRHEAGLRFLLVGLPNEIDDPGEFDNFHSAAETANIDKALSRFNGALRALAERTPGAAYFDVDGWFRRLWGARNANGLPDYRTVTIGDGFQVTNTAGNDPHNALLEDHHAGVVWNALWVQSLVLRLREAFGVSVAPIGDDELWRYLQPLVAPAGSVKAPGS